MVPSYLEIKLYAALQEIKFLKDLLRAHHACRPPIPIHEQWGKECEICKEYDYVRRINE